METVDDSSEDLLGLKPRKKVERNTSAPLPGMLQVSGKPTYYNFSGFFAKFLSSSQLRFLKLHIHCLFSIHVFSFK